MKLTGISGSDIKTINFNGTRVLKNTVSQLSKNNKYSLTEPNQRYISNSIKELGEVSGEKTVKFLIQTAARLKYSTNIHLKDNPLNNWKEMLLNAASHALSITPMINQTEFAQKIEELRLETELNKIEKEILDMRENLLNSVDLKQIKAETVGGIRDFKRNLDYFIVSSETTLKHKKYVLKKLLYLMSDRYKINTQLQDKKSIVAAELVNDMAIFTPGHKIPNIKAVNQKQHGMCAAISIVRKKVAYEDKPNYIDSILSELDNTPFIQVYDRSKLGTGKKVAFFKTPVDFEAALEKGYRIIDASSTQWMDLATKSGYSGNTFDTYTPFDRENFDINNDSFYNKKFEEPELQELQGYYQALVKANSVINAYKAEMIAGKVRQEEKTEGFSGNIKAIQQITNRLNEIIESLGPELNADERKSLLNGLLGLEQKYSAKIKSNEKYKYIVNEEESVKKDKIRKYLLKNDVKAKNINHDNIDRIYSLVTLHHTLEGEVTKSKPKSIQRASELYEIAAGIRYQLLKGLENETTLNYMMKKMNIPNREECLKNTADELIYKLQNNDIESEAIVNSLYMNTGGAVTNIDEACNLLSVMIKEIDKIVTTEANKIYKKININSRTDAFVEFLDKLQLNITESPNSPIASSVAEKLGVKNSFESIIPKLEEMKNGLLTNKIGFNEAFNKLGTSSQTVFLFNIIENYAHDMVEEDKTELLESFITTNHLDMNNIEEAINNELDKIADEINNLEHYLNTYSNLLTIRDNDGNILYSPEPSDLIMKKFENDNTIPSYSELKELQTHLDRIKKETSADEFNSRQGKLRNKSLYRFSEKEKVTLNKVEKNINPMARYIKKQLSYIQDYIKVPLEELKRNVGLNRGHWWVLKEGESGLSRGQNIRILEYITGRPHYTTSDIKNGIERIKTSPYSGISSSSVFHDKVGMHAQYIADIKPVEIKSSGDRAPETVDILFHDNSWGASEHENIWVDSSGLMRTDYSDNRGGTLGYVTDKKFRNGNIVSRITDEMIIDEEPTVVNSREYKKITKNDFESYKAPQYSTLTLDGKSPNSYSIADSINDIVFKPSSRLLPTLKKIIEDGEITSADISAKLKQLQGYKNNWEEIGDMLMKRMRGEDSNPVISSQEDYDNLPDDDILKVILGKAALLRNYPIGDMEHKMVNIKNIKDLDKYITLQKERAISDFKYTFGENTDIRDYLLESLTDADDKVIEDVLHKFGIELTADQSFNVFYKFKPGKDFDGSIKHTIQSYINNVCTKLEQAAKNNSANSEISALLNDILSKKLYFNKSDINKPEIAHIVKFIDRVYNPSDNTALVKIFRKLQNMTNEEFDSKIIPLLNNEDLNIKDGTGYSLLKRIQRHEDSAENAIYNTIYFDELVKNTDYPVPYVDYDYSKLHRKPKVLSEYNFDNIYSELKSDLDLLKLPKDFNKYKGRNLEKYGAYPAYPKIEHISDSLFNIITEDFLNPFYGSIQKIKSYNDLIEYYETADKLKKYTSKLKKTSKVSKKDYGNINLLLGKLCMLANGDESQIEILEAAENAMELEEGCKYSDYKLYIDKITETINGYKTLTPVSALKQEIENEKKLMSKQTELFVNIFIRTRYKNNFMTTLNKLKQSLIKDKEDNFGNKLSDEYWDKVIDALHDYIILQEPEELLQRYIESIPEDSNLHRDNGSFEGLLKRSLNYAKLYEIQTTIMRALSKGIETDVKASFKDIQIPLSDGTETQMNSNDVIATIIHGLIYDDNFETALLFLDKFGLNETYVSYISKDYFDYDEYKAAIKEIADKHKAYLDFTTIFNENYAKTYNAISEGQNAVKSINNFIRILTKAAKENSIDKEHLKIFLKAIYLCKETWNKKPQYAAADVFQEIMNQGGKEYEEEVSSLFENSNKILESQETVMNLVNQVPLTPISQAFKDREEANKKFKELVEYNNGLLAGLQPAE